jgi:hypothetical protein
MSASILWEPINENPKRLGCWTPSAFQEVMERAGLRLPVTLEPKDIPKLAGMAATMIPLGQNDAAPNPFQQLIDAIESNGAISVWAQY